MSKFGGGVAGARGDGQDCAMQVGTEALVSLRMGVRRSVDGSGGGVSGGSDHFYGGCNQWAGVNYFVIFLTNGSRMSGWVKVEE
jgi:hypothetical protein